VPGNSWLSLDTPLEPFANPIGQPGGDYLTSHDVTSIKKLGYSYGHGSLDAPLGDAHGEPLLMNKPAPVLRVTGANRAASSGSFLMTVWGDVNGDGKKDKLIGLEPVLSRHKVEGCANCGTHLGVKTFINIHAMRDIDNINDRVEVRVHTRDDPTGKAKDNVQWKKTKGRVGAIFK
jgi:tyrosinase